MAPYLLVLLVVAQSPFPLVAGSAPILSKNCGDDRVVYSESGLDFFVDQTKVEGIAPICKLLELGFSNGCFSGDRGGEEWGRIVEKYCGRRFFATVRAEHDAVSGNLLRRTGRKLLLQLPENVSTFDALSRSKNSHDKKEPHNFWLAPDHVSVAAPGILLLCCTLLCPCFRAKRKEVIDHTILAKNLGSMDSSSSFEVSSTSERIPQSPLRVPPSPSRFSKPPQITKIGSLDVSVDQIIKATRNFSLSLKVGEGGFGTVYKGMLPDGQIVAIKRAKKEHFASLRVEFRNEVELLTKIDHRNLVRLLGYIDKGNEHIIITEYVPNGTLRDHLDGQYGRILDFNQRLEIAIDVAHGLTYLHLYAEKPIIHRDVKSSNILLMENFRAKVADFGFARTGPMEAEQTHIVTQVKGTVGYLDPEYTRTNQLTPKSDVYSFGILLIEILSARRPVDLKRAANERITVRWAFGLYNGGNVREILDPLLEEVVEEAVVKKMLDLAFQCAAPTRSDRPDMKEVVEQLWSIRRDHGRSLKRIAKH